MHRNIICITRACVCARAVTIKNSNVLLSSTEAIAAATRETINRGGIYICNPHAVGRTDGQSRRDGGPLSRHLLLPSLSSVPCRKSRSRTAVLQRRPADRNNFNGNVGRHATVTSASFRPRPKTSRSTFSGFVRKYCENDRIRGLRCESKYKKNRFDTKL